MRTYLTATLYLACCMWLFPADAWAEPVQWQPDAVIERFETHIRVTPDGRMETRQVRHIRLTSPLAFNQLGDVRIGFDREFEELEIETARVVLPDGKVVDLPERGRIITTPDAVAACPSFAQYNEWVLAMVGVETGATLELSWVVRDRATRRDHYEALVVLGDRFPIVHAEVTLEVPARLPLERLALMPDGNPIPEKEPVHKAASTVWGWELKQIAASSGSLETALVRQPFVLFSTAGSWEKLLEPLQQRMAQAAEGVGPAILKAMESDLTKAPRGLPRSLAIVQGIAQRMRRVGHEVVPMALPVRDLALVWQTREATPLEMALLTLVALQADGVTARLQGYLPFLPKGTFAVPAAFASWGSLRVAFQDALWGEFRLAPFAMDPDSTPSASLGQSLVATPAEGRVTITPLQEESQAAMAGVDVRTTVKAVGSSLKLEVQVRAWGAANPWYRWGRVFVEAQAKSAFADLVLEGITVDGVAARSWSPLESELRLTATLPATKGVVLADMLPLSGWLEPLVSAWMDKAVVPCSGCTLTYHSLVEVEETALAFTPGLPEGGCAERQACFATHVTQGDGSRRVESELRVTGASSSLPEVLARFLAAGRARSILVWTGSK